MQNINQNKEIARKLKRIQRRGPAQSGPTQQTSRHFQRDQG